MEFAPWVFSISHAAANSATRRSALISVFVDFFISHHTFSEVFSPNRPVGLKISTTISSANMNASENVV